MAQENRLVQAGIDAGSTSICQRCGGVLSVQDGTDVDTAKDIGGFEETYQCERCDSIGRYTYRYTDGKQTFSGACADYDS